MTHSAIGNLKVHEARIHLAELRATRERHPQTAVWIDPMIVAVDQAIADFEENERDKIGPQPSRWSGAILALLALAGLFVAVRFIVAITQALVAP